MNAEEWIDEVIRRAPAASDVLYLTPAEFADVVEAFNATLDPDAISRGSVRPASVHRPFGNRLYFRPVVVLPDPATLVEMSAP